MPDKASTVANVASAEDHVPPAVVLVNVVESDPHTVVAPEIEAGCTFTVKGHSALQPLGIV